MRDRCGKTSGFTLIELVLVMTIIAILAGVLAPSLGGFTTGRRTHNVATMLVSLGQFGRMQAMSEGRTYRLNFDPSRETVWLTYQKGGAFVAASDDYGKPLVMPDGVRFTCDIPPAQDGQYIEFHSDGRTDPVKIMLDDALGNKIEVACSSATELFRIVPPGEQ